MKIEIELPASDLKRAVAGLGKVMGRSGLPALRCVRLVRTESRQITLAVTDLDSLATYRVQEPQPGDPVTMLVPWELFVKAARATKERAVFVREKADTVVIRTFIGSMSFEEPAAMPPLDEWPKLEEVTGPAHEMKEGFRTAFVQAMSCASTDSSRFVLNGVCLDLTRPDAHYVVGTDARRLYAANSFAFDLPRSIIVPNRKFLAWAGFLEDGDWQLRVKLEPESKDGGWVEIRSACWTLQTRLIGGEYPNWRQIFPSEESPATTVRLTPEAAKMLLEVVPMLRTADRMKESACFCVHGDTLILHSRSTPEEAWQEIVVPGATAFGPSTTVLINKEQFTQALRMGFDQIELREEGWPTVLRAAGKQLALGYVRGDMPHSTTVESNIPSATQPSTTATETERNPMNTNTTTERPKTTSTPEQPETELRAAMLQVESVRNTFRESLNGLNQVMNLLKAAEKEQKSSDREIESVRSTLRSLQRVQI